MLRGLPDNYVDSVVTDPPYGLSKEPDINEVLTKWLAGEPYDHGHGGFMGKAWDSFVPHPDIWREVYRVLKPGGHALVFAGTRTQDLMTIALRMAGFEVRDVIEWLYFSGFPKSMDVGKAFDKRNGRNYPDDDFRDYLKQRAKDAGLTGADVDRSLGTNGMWGHYTGRSQPAYPTVEAYGKMKRLLSLDDRYDEIVTRAEAEREKVGEYEYKRKGDGTWDTESPGGMFGAQERTVDITAPATELARKWDGWGTALKPAHEPIIVVRKPLVATVADNVEKYGTGAINIDGCRIPYRSDDDLQTVKAKTSFTEKSKSIGFGTPDTLYGTGSTPLQQARQSVDEAGRFPANCITTDADAFYSPYFNVDQSLAESGTVSPPELSKKASKRDRNADWTGAEITLESRQAGALKGRNDGSLGTVTYNRNTHPTVKPVDLMAWLVRLVTKPNGLVLDPFAGSGSTLVAAKREGFDFIGIEREPEYVEIAKARVGVS